MSTVSVGNILLDKEILLESGTNELEVLVFRIGNQMFGINVAKVREVLPRAEITQLAKAHPAVRGVFKLRDAVIPCVSLVDHLKLDSDHPDAEGTMILSDFNQQQTAFLVDQVDRIHRISWEKIQAVPKMLERADTPLTAVARIDERLVMMLDFETILDQVTDNRHCAQAIDNPHGLPRQALRILMADDSPTVRQAVSQTLRKSGYTDLQVCENGSVAWDWLEARARTAESVRDVIDLVVSDVEMPMVDGFHLTKRIKGHPLLCKAPVILYSSIVTPDNHKKGEAVGADAQISKPELGKLVELADALILKARPELGGEQRWSQEAPSEPTVESFIESPAMIEPPGTMESPRSEETELADPPSEIGQSSSPSLGQPNSTSAAIQVPPLAPSGPLWHTLQAELVEHAGRLQTVVLDHLDLGQDQIHEALRVLHTIKSAAMVVPVDAITRTTHELEDILASARDTEKSASSSTLERYADWLAAIAVENGSGITALLADFRTVLEEPSKQLATTTA